MVVPSVFSSREHKSFFSHLDKFLLVMAKLTENGGCKANMVGFSIHLLMSRWFMVFACLLIMSMAGATYLFSLYSNEIKSS